MASKRLFAFAKQVLLNNPKLARRVLVAASGVALVTTVSQVRPISFNVPIRQIACDPARSHVNPDPIFSPDQLAAFASRVTDLVRIPLLPAAAERLVIVKALAAFVGVLTNDLTERLRIELKNAMLGTLDPDQEQQFVKELAHCMVGKIDLPFMHEDEKQVLFEDIVQAVLTLSRPPDDGIAHHTAFHLMHEASGSLKVLLAPEQRKKLAEHIVATTPLPFIDKAREQEFVEQAISVIASRVNGLLPGDFVLALRGASPEEMTKVHDRLVERLMATARVPMINNDMQQALYDRVVTLMLEGVASGSTPAFLDDIATRLLKAQEQEHILKEELIDLEAHAVERRKILQNQLYRVQQTRWELQKQTSWFYYISSFFGLL